MKTALIFILSVLILSSAAVFAQDNESDQQGTISSIQEIGYRTVIIQQVPARDLQILLEDLDSRLQNLELQKNPQAQVTKEVPLFDYLSTINLILIVIIFFIMLRMRQKPVSPASVSQ